MAANLLGIENAVLMKKRKISSEPVDPKLKKVDTRLDDDSKRFDNMINKYRKDCSCNKLVEDGLELKNFLRMICDDHIKECVTSYAYPDTLDNLRYINDYSRENDFPMADKYSQKIMKFIKNTEAIFKTYT